MGGSGLMPCRGLVSKAMRLDLLTGALIVFCNGRRNRVRCLLWDGSGFWLATKRVERATFAWPRDEAQRSAWCREKGVSPSDLAQWRESAMAALAQPEEARATAQETRADRRRIKELEKDLRRKEKALAETTALLVLRKKLQAIFQESGDE